jgi:hypothetical protein
MFSSRFARSMWTTLALGTTLALACAPAPNDGSNGDDDEGGSGGADDPQGGSGGKKASGTGGKGMTGTGGTQADNGGSPGSGGASSGGTSGGEGGAGDGGTSGGTGGTSGGTGGTSGGTGGTSGGTGGTSGGSGGKSGGTGGTSGGTGGTSGATPTFTELYDSVFGVAASPMSCWGAKCHNPGVEDKVDMSSKAKAYTTLLAKVKPGNPAASALITRLESTDVKKRMPLNKPALDKATIAKVKAWIMAGAMNN